MIAFFKSKAISKVDELLCDGVMYSLNDICKIIRENNERLKQMEKLKKGK